MHIPVWGSGMIPKWINGALLRNGPGSLKVGNEQFRHLFDASALLHRFSIDNGQVSYQCRFLESESFKKNHIAKRIVVTEFGTRAIPDPCQSIFSRAASIFEAGRSISDNPMISVYPFGDEFYALTETPIMYRIDKNNLETIEKVEIGKKLGVVSHSSHPHIAQNGTIYNMGMIITLNGPQYCVVKFPPNKNGNVFDLATIVAKIPVRWPLNPCYMHTFGMTKNYFVIVEQPLSISVPQMLKGRMCADPMINCLRWFKNQMTFIYVINKANGKLEKIFKAQPFFYLHIINQYEKQHHIILDICCYRDPAMVKCMYINTMKQMQFDKNYATMFRGRPIRFALPLQDKQGNEKLGQINENLIKLSFTNAWAYYGNDGFINVIPEQLYDIGCETPTINYRKHLGKPYRYFYAISSDVDLKNPGTLIKVDIESKSIKTWNEFNCYPSEPIFVSKPNPQSEDDGVVLSSLVWGRRSTHKVALLILCAKTWREIGRCSFKTPGPVPKCLHGWFANHRKDKSS